MEPTAEIYKRRPELDWLRVILVLMVFLHHVAMPFNGDKWHIMNADKSKLLDDVMVYFEQWRLPLLLLVSGAGTVLAFSKRSAWQFVKEQSRRLLIPLIFGAMVIIPPQTYFQLIDQYSSYFDLYSDAILKSKSNLDRLVIEPSSVGK
jgi:glucans biosynthesis protein C